MPPRTHWLEQQLKDLFPSQLKKAHATTNGTGPDFVTSNGDLSRYMAVALAGVINDLRNSREGNRNTTLNSSAYRLGRFVAGGHLEESIARAQLVHAARVCGLREDEITKTVESGLAAGMLEPFTLDGNDYREPTSEPTEPTEPARTLASYVLRFDQLGTLPTPMPLIHDTIDLGTVVLLAGYWGTCKSFLAQDWSACVATGKQWQARTVEKRKILYLAGEGAFGLYDRFTSWQTRWQTTVDPSMFDVLPVAPNLGRLAAVAELCELVSAGGYGFVVIDTLAKCMVGLDENSAQDMGRIVEALYRIRTATMDSKGTVLAVHHTGKDKMTTRGSSALEGGVDCVYKTEGNPEEIKLTREKRKDGPTHDELKLCLSPVEYTNSAVLERLSEGAASTDRATKLLFTYHQYYRGTGCTRSQLLSVSDMSERTFQRALNDLILAGDLIKRGHVYSEPAV